MQFIEIMKLHRKKKSLHVQNLILFFIVVDDPEPFKTKGIYDAV